MTDAITVSPALPTETARSEVAEIFTLARQYDRFSAHLLSCPTPILATLQRDIMFAQVAHLQQLAENQSGQKC